MSLWTWHRAGAMTWSGLVEQVQFHPCPRWLLSFGSASLSVWLSLLVGWLLQLQLYCFPAGRRTGERQHAKNKWPLLRGFRSSVKSHKKTSALARPLSRSLWIQGGQEMSQLGILQNKIGVLFSTTGRLDIELATNSLSPSQFVF